MPKPHRINISVPADLHRLIMQYKDTLNISGICQQALRKAIIEEYARREQIKLIAGIKDTE